MRKLNKEEEGYNKKKEENIMKRTRKNNCLVTVVAAVLAMAMLTACNGEVTSPATTTPEPTKAVAEPTKVAEPTEAPVEVKPTEAPVEVEPTEAPVEENPNIIEGIDFTAFNEGRTPLSKVVSNFTFDSVRLIPLQKYYAEALIKDNDSFTMVQDPEANYPGLYSFVIYTPKEVMNLKASTEGVEINEIADDWIMGDGLKYYLIVPDDLVGTDIPISFTVVYPDGGCEQFGMHITKDYVVER